MTTVFYLRMLASEAQEKPHAAEFQCSLVHGVISPVSSPLLSSWLQTLTPPSTCIAEMVLWQGKQPALTHIIVMSRGWAYAAFSSIPPDLFWSWSSGCPVTLACHPPWHFLDTVSCYSGRNRERLRIRNLVLRCRRTTWGVSTPSVSPHNLRNVLSSHPYYSCTRKRKGMICFPCLFHLDGNIM